MDWYAYPLVVAAGFIAGFVNTLALGNMAGAAVAAKQAAKRGAGFVRILLMVVVAVAAFRYLGVPGLLRRLLPVE